MKISYQFLAIGILYLMPLASRAQEVVPYANSEVKVDWVRGTDFSKYKTYAWGTPDPLTTLTPLYRQRVCKRWGWTRIRASSSLFALGTSKYMYFSTSPKIQS
jgi:hypothetical protein